MGSGYLPPRLTRRSGERHSSSSGVRGGGLAENENDFGAIYARKPPSVNRILLNVARCCVIEVLE